MLLIAMTTNTPSPAIRAEVPGSGIRDDPIRVMQKNPRMHPERFRPHWVWPRVEKIGGSRNGSWLIDSDVSGRWSTVDKNDAFGSTGWIPFVRGMDPILSENSNRKKYAIG